MTIPFLKKREEVAASGEDSPIGRSPDHESEDMLDVIAGDMLDALENKNKDLLVGALDALCEYIKDETQNYE